MKIFIDDGSTNIKLAWIQDGNKCTSVSPNSFKREWSVPFGDQPVFNYQIEGECYSWDPVSHDAVKTTHTRYQYNDVNVISIHHALLKTGIEPQKIDIEVTLPLGEYLDEHNQPNQKNIERKKQNVKRKVTVNGGETFTIGNVRVMPESIPAGFDVVKDLNDLDSLLIVDLGGTTLDIAQVRGKMTGITKTYCDPDIGISLVTEAVLQALSKTNTKTSRYFADDLLVHRHDRAYLRTRVNDEQQLMAVLSAITEKESMLVRRVQDAVSNFSGYTHAMVIGGGAEIIAQIVKKTTGIKENRFFKSQEPQLDLVNGMMAMGKASE